ncbi:MAG: short-chain fatty acyl-CoA regulator family protein [Pseudomonadota bacterium]
MPMTALTGSRVRERRMSLGLRQADLARDAGISASYLNLIEHNRRRVGADVLVRLAGVLAVPVAALSMGTEGILTQDLRAAAAAVGGAPRAELDRTEDFATRFPGWAGVVAALHARAAGLERAVAALNDRITHDPHLSASLHELLSAVASVRSTAAILAESDQIDPVWRERFHHNLHQDSERLAVGAEALVAYLDGSAQAEGQGVADPQDELEVWLSAQGWHLAALETGGAGPQALEAGIAALATRAARDLARAWVAQAMRDAQALPLADLAQAITTFGPDPARLADAFGVDILSVFRRLALRPGSPFGLVTCDGSGTLLFRKPADGFAVPRFGAACPLWPLYTALSHPASPVEALVETAGRGGARFRIRAFCRTRFPAGFAGPEVREAAMLIQPQPDGAGQAMAVGSTCRICPRANCPARREPSILSETA